MGDLFFHDRFPYVDMDSGGDPQNLAASVRAMLDMIGPDTRIIPGHGPLATRAELERYLAMITATTEVVRAEIAAGRSLAQIQKKGLPAQWKGWAWQFISEERWIATLHRSLTAPR